MWIGRQTAPRVVCSRPASGNSGWKSVSTSVQLAPTKTRTPISMESAEQITTPETLELSPMTIFDPARAVKEQGRCNRSGFAPLRETRCTPLPSRISPPARNADARQSRATDTLPALDARRPEPPRGKPSVQQPLSGRRQPASQPEQRSLEHALHCYSPRAAGSAGFQSTGNRDGGTTHPCPGSAGFLACWGGLWCWLPACQRFTLFLPLCRPAGSKDGFGRTPNLAGKTPALLISAPVTPRPNPKPPWHLSPSLYGLTRPAAATAAPHPPVLGAQASSLRGWVVVRASGHQGVGG